MASGSVYTTEDVLTMMEDDDIQEPMCEFSDDELGIDLHDSEDESRYVCM